MRPVRAVRDVKPAIEVAREWLMRRVHPQESPYNSLAALIEREREEARKAGAEKMREMVESSIREAASIWRSWLTSDGRCAAGACETLIGRIRHDCALSLPAAPTDQEV